AAEIIGKYERVVDAGVRADERHAAPKILAVATGELVHDDELNGAVGVREELLDLEQMEVGERSRRNEHQDRYRRTKPAFHRDLRNRRDGAFRDPPQWNLVDAQQTTLSGLYSRRPACCF